LALKRAAVGQELRMYIGGIMVDWQEEKYCCLGMGDKNQ
jgi:hypothetical protein